MNWQDFTRKILRLFFANKVFEKTIIKV